MFNFVTDSLDSFTGSFTNIRQSDEILFLSAYENVKVVEQDSQLNWEEHSHPVNISEERVEGASKITLVQGG
ncbi:MAG: hypothetical protein ACJ0G5_05115 [Alphaproteobacteria bacterium]